MKGMGIYRAARRWIDRFAAVKAYGEKTFGVLLDVPMPVLLGIVPLDLSARWAIEKVISRIITTSCFLTLNIMNARGLVDCADDSLCADRTRRYLWVARTDPIFQLYVGCRTAYFLKRIVKYLIHWRMFLL